MFEECTNPLCEKPIESDSGNSWRRTPKKFCSDKCKTDVWALRKAAALLSAISDEKKLEILDLVASHGDQGEINQEDQHKTSVDNQREINGVNKEDINGVRRYSCRRWPHLDIGGKVRFHEGLFETADPKLMFLVEQNEAYGAQILKIEIPEQ